MKKGLLLGLTTIIMCLVLVGCGKKSATIVGSWVSKDYGDSFVYTFKKDGTGTYLVGETTMEFDYKTDGNKLSITYKGNTASFDTEYSIENNTLNVKDSFGKDTLYVRK